MCSRAWPRGAVPPARRAGRGKMLSSTFMDLERIEVLKGPQTTYFGNNAISGALNIITKIPDFEFGGRARVLYGSYGAFAAEAAVNIPLSDRLAVRIAGLANGQNGWVRNVVDGEKGPRERNYVGRISARFAASDELDFLLKLERGRNKFENASGGMPGQRSEEHTSELQSLMRISYAVFCLKKKQQTKVLRLN